MESSDTDNPYAINNKNLKACKKGGMIANKKGRRSTWQDCHIKDLVDVISSSEYFERRLIFTNMKNNKNGEIYEQVLKEAKERYVTQSDEFPFNVSQNCISGCKKVALTAKTAMGIEWIKEEKNFGSWFSQPY